MNKCVYYDISHIRLPWNRRGSINFSKGGGLRWKILKEKCLLIHIKTILSFNSFSLLPFQEVCFFFFVLFFFSFLFLKFEKGGGVATPVPPSRSANAGIRTDGTQEISLLPCGASECVTIALGHDVTWSHCVTLNTFICIH